MEKKGREAFKLKHIKKDRDLTQRENKWKFSGINLTSWRAKETKKNLKSASFQERDSYKSNNKSRMKLTR